MIPKSSSWSALVQFAGYRATVTFRRKGVFLGCAAQLSTKRIIFLFCVPIHVSKEWRNEQKISVVIHALLFAWYLIGIFLTSLKHLGLEDFPITIVMQKSIFFVTYVQLYYAFVFIWLCWFSTQVFVHIDRILFLKCPYFWQFAHHRGRKYFKVNFNITHVGIFLIVFCQYLFMEPFQVICSEHSVSQNFHRRKTVFEVLIYIFVPKFSKHSLK
jgi:hypothetical protein